MTDLTCTESRNVARIFLLSDCFCALEHPLVQMQRHPFCFQFVTEQFDLFIFLKDVLISLTCSCVAFGESFPFQDVPRLPY